MSSFEFNKIAGAVLLSGLIAMVVGVVAEGLYHTEEQPEKRGFSVEVAEEGGEGASGKQEEAPVDIGTLLAAASVDAGASQAKKCASCHTFDKGGANKIGPNLWGVLGGAKAHAQGFAYSDAMKAAGGAWTYDDFFAFMHKPGKFIPGTKMSFAGIKNPKDVADLVAYMRTMHDSAPALPAPKAAPAAAEEGAAEEKKPAENLPATLE